LFFEDAVWPASTQSVKKNDTLSSRTPDARGRAKNPRRILRPRVPTQHRRVRRHAKPEVAYHLVSMAAQATAIICILVTALAVAAGEPPSTQSDKTWELPGLSGTALQIKVQLHQELDEIDGKIAAAEGDVRSAEAEMQKHRDFVVSQLPTKGDATYQYVCKTIADSEQELATTADKARADELRLKIDGFTKRRKTIEALAVQSDLETPRFLAVENQKRAEVDRLKKDLDKCIDWRCEIGSAVRGGLALQWPVKVGAVGILGPIKIVSVDRDGWVAAEGAIFMPMSQDAKRTEGIVTVRGRTIPATFLIGGWDDQPAAAGASTFMDEMVRVESCESDSDGLAIRVQRCSCADDEILADFRVFRKAGEGDLGSR
jgi:hypothetical protein